MAHERQRRWLQPRQAPPVVAQQAARDALAQVTRGKPTSVDPEGLAAEGGYQAANDRQRAALGRMVAILEGCKARCTCGGVETTLALHPSQVSVDAGAALAALVALHDGPRDGAYEKAKPEAWAAARKALGLES